MKHFTLLCLLVSLVSLSSYTASWHLFIVTDSSDGLNDMAIKNITDLLREKINDSVSVSLQLHAYDMVGLRYHVTKHGLEFMGQTSLSGDSKQDFIDAALWGLGNNNADHTMLIFSSHGWGILDPEWNDDKKEWEAGDDSLSDSLSNSCPMKGFMFSAQPRTYLHNEDMIEGLAFIQKNLLHGKKIDILAFDTCMGGMLEVAYQVAPYTQYLVGNTVCALRDGFDYEHILKALNQGPLPREMAQKMVHIFDDYYSTHDAKGVYAHTALDTSYADQIAQALDAIITLLLKREDGAIIARNACTHAPRFCIFPMYTDLISYIKEIEKALPDDETTAQIKKAISHFYNIMSHAIVAHCQGYSNINRANGCAIYLPTKTIHKSYTQTLFGKQTKWTDLLKCIEHPGIP